MAWIDGVRIRDRLPQCGRKLCYTLPEAQLAEAVGLHDSIVAYLDKPRLLSITSAQMKAMVARALATPKAHRAEAIRSLLALSTSTSRDDVSLSSIIEEYLAHALATRREGTHTELRRAAERWSQFFASEGIEYAAQFDHGAAQRYASEWRPNFRPTTNRTISYQVGSRSIGFEVRFMDDALKFARKARRIQWADQCEDVVVRENAKVVQPLDDAQVRSLVAYLTATERRKWALHASLALLTTGMRASELGASRREDWIDTDSYVQVWSGKTENAMRKIPMPMPLGRALADAGIIFQEEHVARRLGLLLTRAEAELGFKVTVHQLRHTCASNWRRADVYDMATIADFLGHADLSFTRSRYSKISNEAGRFPAIRQRYKSLVKWLHDFPIGGAAAEIEKHLSRAA